MKRFVSLLLILFVLSFSLSMVACNSQEKTSTDTENKGTGLTREEVVELVEELLSKYKSEQETGTGQEQDNEIKLEEQEVLAVLYPHKVEWACPHCGCDLWVTSYAEQSWWCKEGCGYLYAWEWNGKTWVMVWLGAK